MKPRLRHLSRHGFVPAKHERRPSLFNREEGKSRGENRCQGDHKGCYQFLHDHRLLASAVTEVIAAVRGAFTLIRGILARSCHVRSRGLCGCLSGG